MGARAQALVPSHPCALLPLHPPALAPSHPCNFLPLCPPALAVRAQGLMPKAVRAQGLVPRVQGLVPMQFELVFCSPPPLSAKRSKSLVKTKSVQVSPPPEHRTTTPCTFTEQQKAFVGPHHLSKISGQKPPINH